MKINIQAPWEVDQSLKALIHEKTNKLDTYFKGIIYTDVFLKMNEHDSPNDKTVEIKVSVPGPYIFAESSSDTYEKALVEATEKIRRQLIKKKEKLNDH